MWNDYVHLVPGRIRLKVPGLKKNPLLAKEIENVLLALQGITSIRINLSLGSMLVFFHPSDIDGFSIIILIEDQRQKFLLDKESTHVVVPAFAQKDLMVPMRELKVGFMGSVLGALYLKHLFFGRSALSKASGLANVATIVGLVLSYPVFLWSLKHPKQSKRWDYDLFMNAIAFLLIILQEDTSALLIALIINASKLVMATYLDHARMAIDKLGTLPEYALLLHNNVEILVPISHVAVDDIIVVNKGQTIPVDGQVLSGEADVDEQELTNLPQYAFKERGSEVFAGTAVLNGSLNIKVIRKGMNTEIYRALKEARLPQPLIKKHVPRPRIDRMVYLSMFVASGVYLLTRDAQRSIAVLIAGNPSAAGLALPTATGVAIDQAFKNGIYIKNGEYLREARDIDTLIFEQQGTLTSSENTISEVVVVNREYTEEELIRFASLAQDLVSPSAVRHIQRPFAKGNAPLTTVQALEIVPGLGLKCVIKGHNVIVGNQDLMKKEQVALGRVKAKLLRFGHLRRSVVFVAIDKKLCGLLAVKENIKLKSRESIDGLRAIGINNIVLLSSDTPEGTDIIGKQLGVMETYGGMGPEEKAEFVRSLQKEGHCVGMIGSGFDDVEALAEADTGIAFSHKAVDPAARTAEIAIPTRDPSLVVETMRLAHKTKEVIQQNLNYAFGLNVIGLGLGAAGLITPIGAAFLGNVGIFAVLLNSKYQRW